MRDYNYELMDEIKKRWSPRAFSDKPVSEDQLMQLVDAARFAPSCFNEQPFRYVLFSSPEEVKLAKAHLKAGNVDWNVNVQAYLGILFKKTWERNGKENRWAAFDTGTSWGLLSLQAIHLGLVTHAMAGFERKALREALSISDDYDFITLIAVGYYGDPKDLSKERQIAEKPNSRHPLTHFIMNRE